MTSVLNESSLKPTVDEKVMPTESLHEEKTNNDGRLRRRMNGPRRIPRSPEAKEIKKGPSGGHGKNGRHKGGRQRSTSESSVNYQRSPRRFSRRRRTASEASAVSTADPSPLRLLRDSVMEKYKKEGLNLMNSYIKNTLELVKFENTAAFLQKCSCLRVVPTKYRLTNTRIRNTKQMTTILDRFSFQAVKADLKHNRKRCMQVKKLLKEKESRMESLFEKEVYEEIMKISGEVHERRSQRVKEQQTKNFNTLVAEYHLTEEDLRLGEEAEAREKEHQERRALQARKKLEDAKAGGDQKTESEEKEIKEE